MKNTREMIVGRALELFNEKGVEYGGMRELAKLLDMRVSNITYYFATKDDLVRELMDRLAKLNNDTTQKHDPVSLSAFLGMYGEMFHNQYAYKCLQMSFVHLFTHHPGLVERYKQNERKRKQKLADIYNAMVAKGYLKGSTGQEVINKLVAHTSLITRFWISESIISYYDKTFEEIVLHYLTLLGDIFLPYTTPKGKKDIGAFFQRLNDS